MGLPECLPHMTPLVPQCSWGGNVRSGQGLEIRVHGHVLALPLTSCVYLAKFLKPLGLYFLSYKMSLRASTLKGCSEYSH